MKVLKQLFLRLHNESSLVIILKSIGGVECQMFIFLATCLSRNFSYAISRLGSRCISSVVPKSDLAVTDFSVQNEPLLSYLPGSKERADLEAALGKYQDVTEDVPIIIGGKEYRTDDVRYQVMVRQNLQSIIILKNCCFFRLRVRYIGPIFTFARKQVT